jgi:hypothetical protein
MYGSPEFAMQVANDYQRNRIAEADRYRVLTRARHARRSRRHARGGFTT